MNIDELKKEMMKSKLVVDRMPKTYFVTNQIGFLLNDVTRFVTSTSDFVGEKLSIYFNDGGHLEILEKDFEHFRSLINQLQSMFLSNSEDNSHAIIADFHRQPEDEGVYTPDFEDEEDM